MEKPKDYYRILGVPRDASPTTIKRAYHRLARKLHTDASAPQAPDALLELEAAYETLIDSDRRRRYDESLDTDRRPGRPASTWSLLRTPGLHGLRRPVARGTLSGEILLRPDEAAAGGVLPLDIPLNSTCPSCDGTGGTAFDCGECGGEGTLQRRLPIALRIPAGVKDGAVFQVDVDDKGVAGVFLTVHIRAL